MDYESGLLLALEANRGVKLFSPYEPPATSSPKPTTISLTIICNELRMRLELTSLPRGVIAVGNQFNDLYDLKSLQTILTNTADKGIKQVQRKDFSPAT